MKQHALHAVVEIFKNSLQIPYETGRLTIWHQYVVYAGEYTLDLERKHFASLKIQGCKYKTVIKNKCLK